MLIGRVRLYDYRCFWREHPATLELRSGLTSFIGPNNAGKSTLIKMLYELRTAIHNIGKLGDSGRQEDYEWALPPSLHEASQIATERDDPKCAIEIEPYMADDEKEHSVTRVRLEFSSNSTAYRVKMYSAEDSEISGRMIHGMSPLGLSIHGGRRLIETARIKNFAKMLATSQYFGPFRNVINEGAGLHFDNQIGTGFIDQWHQWKVGSKKAEKVAIGRVTEDIRRLIGADTLEINASKELKTLQIMVDGNHLSLQELGSGFSQLVVVLGNALLRKPSFILIDEPELHLHPALQSDFLTTLASYAQYGLLYTTHSMGLARLADHCYAVQRKGKKSIVRSFERTSNYAEFLGSLGIAGLRDLGWNRILLVEGPKDVRTTQQLLRRYGKDRHTIVLPLGGDSMVNGNIAHELSEIQKLCATHDPEQQQARVFALVDSERDSAKSAPIKARQEFEDICKGLEIDCCVTERRAIENYISQQAIDAAWGENRYRALEPFDLPAKDGSFWGKGETWKAAKNLTMEEIGATDIGEFFARM